MVERVGPAGSETGGGVRPARPGTRLYSRHIPVRRVAFHDVLGRSLVTNLLCGWASIGTFALVAHLVPSDVAHLDTTERALREYPATGEAARLLARHADSCWTAGEAAKAPLPDAAIVELVDKRRGDVDVTYTDRQALVDDAFREALGESNRGALTVVALCIQERP